MLRGLECGPLLFRVIIGKLKIKILWIILFVFHKHEKFEVTTVLQVVSYLLQGLSHSENNIKNYYLPLFTHCTVVTVLAASDLQYKGRNYYW